jgi:hypothetical protein
MKVEQLSLAQDENSAPPSVPRQAISEEPTKKPPALPSPSLPKGELVYTEFCHCNSELDMTFVCAF